MFRFFNVRSSMVEVEVASASLVARALDEVLDSGRLQAGIQTSSAVLAAGSSS